MYKSQTIATHTHTMYMYSAQEQMIYHEKKVSSNNLDLHCTCTTQAGNCHLVTTISRKEVT